MKLIPTYTNESWHRMHTVWCKLNSQLYILSDIYPLQHNNANTKKLDEAIKLGWSYLVKHVL